MNNNEYINLLTKYFREKLHKSYYSTLPFPVYVYMYDACETVFKQFYDLFHALLCVYEVMSFAIFLTE